MKILLIITAIILGTSTSATANEIIVDFKNKQVIYKDETTNLSKIYPAVFPKESATYVYKSNNIFDIDAMHLKPNWISSTGQKYPGGSPGNPLGAGRIRFLSSKKDGSERNCSIHGGARRRDLGQSLSNCCIRLLDEDFLDLFWKITYETKVIFKK